MKTTRTGLVSYKGLSLYDQYEKIIEESGGFQEVARDPVIALITKACKYITEDKNEQHSHGLISDQDYQKYCNDISVYLTWWITLILILKAASNDSLIIYVKEVRDTSPPIMLDVADLNSYEISGCVKTNGHAPVFVVYEGNKESCVEIREVIYNRESKLITAFKNSLPINGQSVLKLGAAITIEAVLGLIETSKN